MHKKNEAYSRIIIDRQLESVGWNLLDPNQVKLELSGVSGESDYVLMGSNGPLCVLEAKNENEDPYNAKEQARKYADELSAPFIILSNGKEHWFWNYALKNNQDAFRIETLPSQRDLEWLVKRNLNPPCSMIKQLTPDYFSDVSEDIKLRGYQLKAVETISHRYDLGDRTFLLEMATGTGKTVLAAAFIKRFLETRNASRVLFIVDRIELAKQTFETFQKLLSDYNPVIYKNARTQPGAIWGSSLVIATIQSLMTGRRFKSEFTPFHFDLVINDEAHRSIYGDSRECVQYFQAVRIGLTATPKAYLKNINLDELQSVNPKALEARQLRDTYNFFGCEPGEPTFRYDIIDAVNDPEGPFLCLPKIWAIKSDITTKSLEEKGWEVEINGSEETFKIRDLERKIFIPSRNELMCKRFLEKAMKDPKGKIGKSIIFAVSQRHATALTKILNSIIPEIAITITSNIKDSSSIAKQFRKGERDERIAVTVDMLSTGYDCSDILNIGLMRPIFSPIQYLQMKGRGTRLHIWSDGFKKRNFNILDFCEVAKYFEDIYDYELPLSVPGESNNIRPKSPIDISLSPNDNGVINDPPLPDESDTVPIYEGIDSVVSEDFKVIGPEGEKVDIFTFRGAFEHDIRVFAKQNPEFQEAVDKEDDEKIEEILEEMFFNKPEMYYSTNKLIYSYGLPATPADFVYNALDKKKLTSSVDLFEDLSSSIAVNNNLNYRESKWLSALGHKISEDPQNLGLFIAEDPYLFDNAQFRCLGGVGHLMNNPKLLKAIGELRSSPTTQKFYEARKHIG